MGGEERVVQLLKHLRNRRLAPIKMTMSSLAHLSVVDHTPSFLDVVAKIKSRNNRRSATRIRVDLERMADPDNALVVDRQKTIVHRSIKKIPLDTVANSD